MSPLLLGRGVVERVVEGVDGFLGSVHRRRAIIGIVKEEQCGKQSWNVREEDSRWHDRT